MRRPTLILLLLAAFALAACGGDGEDERSSLDPKGATAPTPAPQQPAAAEEEGGVPEGCEEAKAPEPRPEGKLKKPSDELDDSNTYTASVKTNCGTFSFELDPKASPQATASIKALADDDFYDDTVFHRIAPDFVIQGGDPKGDGSGGPGYKTVDKPASDTKYEKYVVAMAKGGPEAAGTAGSQFFVVTGPGGGNLTPEYAVVGTVTKGKEVVDRIGKLGGSDEQPTATVVIQDLTVEES